MASKSKSTDTKNRFVIIMAGGRGERFWPVSREKTPKQLIKLFGDKSFLQQAVAHVAPLVPMKNIFIITNEAQAAEVRKQLPKLPKENVVAEPMGRDTCAAVTLGAALVGARNAEQARHNAAAMDFVLSKDERSDIRRAFDETSHVMTGG